MRIFLLLSVLLCATQVSGQNVTVRLTLNYGASLYFHFNSMSKYQTGITYTDYTEFRINYTDTTDAGLVTGSTWQLTVKPLSATILGDAGNTIGLDQIEISTSIDGIFHSTETLSNAGIVIASGTQTSIEEVHTITLSYACGTIAPGLISKTPDFYFVDLEFTLEKAP